MTPRAANSYADVDLSAAGAAHHLTKILCQSEREVQM
jgi:hypothetical protein